MKFLIITSEFPPIPGGIGNHAYGLLLSLKIKGHDVRVITNSRDEELEKNWLIQNRLEDLVNYVRRFKPVIITYINRCRVVFREVRILHKQEKTGVLIFSGKFSLWLLGILPVSQSLKKIVVIHGTEIRQNAIGSWLFRRAFQKAHNIVSVSTFTQGKLLEDFIIPLNKIKVINNGFLSTSEINSIQHKINNFSGVCNLITVGNLSRRKGQFNVVNAIPELIKLFPLVQYHIVGIPTEAAALQEVIQQFHLDDKVIIHGAVSEVEKYEYLSNASVFIMLSENLPNGDFEGFGIAILEANYLGLPSIGSKNSGIADAISNGYSGLLVDSHNPTEIVEAIRVIMSDYSTYSKQAHQHASKFKWEHKVQEYLSLLD